MTKQLLTWYQRGSFLSVEFTVRQCCDLRCSFSKCNYFCSLYSGSNPVSLVKVLSQSRTNWKSLQDCAKRYANFGKIAKKKKSLQKNSALRQFVKLPKNFSLQYLLWFIECDISLFRWKNRELITVLPQNCPHQAVTYDFSWNGVAQ